MILNNTTADIQVIGDIQTNKISIDINNLDYITTILSSNLYSNPERSFIREIVSNAWDSHVEAGNTEHPVIINIDVNERYVSIRDYGTGISPERFNNIYLCIGNSTKRDSNEYIGGFGLGRFSAMACSNIAYITSYYDNIKYSYIMVKEGNTINVDLISTETTEEHNGLEVKLCDIRNVIPYLDGLEYIVYFPNIYINLIGASNYYADKVNAINNVQYKKYKTFAVHSKSYGIEDRSLILLGNVLYPLSIDSWMPEHLAALYKEVKRICNITFDIGELDITPNREEILYSKRTIDAIINKFYEFEKEFYNLYLDQFEGRKINNIKDFYCIFKPYTKLHFPEVKKEVTFPSKHFHTWYSHEGNINGSLMGKYENKITNISDAIRLCNVNLPFYCGRIRCGKYSKRTYYIDFSNIYPTNTDGYKCLLIKNSNAINKYIKAYLEDKYDGYHIFKHTNNIDEFIRCTINNSSYFNASDENKFILTEIYNYLNDNIPIVDVQNDPDYIKFKEECKEKTTASQYVRENIVLYRYWNDGSRSKMHLDSYQDLITFIKREHQGVVLTAAREKNNDLIWSLCNLLDYKIYSIESTLLNKLFKENLSNVINIDEKLNSDPKWLELIKFMHTFKDYAPHYSNLFSIRYLIPKKDRKEIDEAYGKFSKLYSNANYLLTFANNCKQESSYAKYIGEKIKMYSNAATQLYKIIEECNMHRDYPILAMLTLKKKLFRIDADYYQSLIHNPFYKLCKLN